MTDTADTFWIDQDAASTSGYRTNIAVVFPDGPGSAIVTVFDSNGVQAGQHVFEQDSAGFVQVSVAGGRRPTQSSPTTSPETARSSPSATSPRGFRTSSSTVSRA